ncbi:hypothetical protein [uncultured Arthrobacter sp.]|uniref:hypothetical protein n=1 Tax=uncultured Arthrobacter sp. TaxID=114050 RepID=UPI0026055B5D|nr:hypothetical protein [uncultured Arthrobacter sp.]
MSITAQAVMRLVLCVSLLVAFTTSAAAALCLQMEQHTPGVMTGSGMAMDSSAPGSGSEGMFMSAGPEGSSSTHACCHQQASTPDPVTPPQRAVPTEPTAVFSLAVMQLPAEHGQPPGLFDPALEKRDHLAPSLAALSISRT